MSRINAKRGIGDAAFLIIAVVIFVLVWLGGPADREDRGPVSGNNVSGNPFVSPDDSGSSADSSDSGQNYLKSLWDGKVTLSRGNAKSEYTPSREYITIRLSSRAKEPANISGWILENGVSGKNYQIGSEVVQGTSKRVIIPQAAKLFLPAGGNVSGPVVLEPGESAVIITGRVPATTPFPLQSFKLNKCSGYIEEMRNVKFYPAISLQCPRPDSYEEVDSMEKSCYDFVSRLSRCHTPEFKDKRLPDGGVESGAVDGVVGLTNQCKAFITTHLNYTSCVANHLADVDFYGKEWRIFLNQPWEMWTKDRETAKLYDSSGRLVDSISW
ncbi:MAG: hypothetical protein A2653_01005 [Candidatus Zambryskibacteria bacterium RIFCSPHIGHO2_01_FULL_43_25]|uniref:LTD domain-containing protein n=1 Tax=Candidatus Zambryskibacteria bacterium RIFCSPLOWO2_01_FULL_45_21 TaxID=1802761 RepID=A0A1G2U4G7_9BACT|nr:MAG: hypothetical protein A2653_01005 [Candidatus Zambryskibacteria bacterium RIFCSPHIGHO2_01_FULL_43_25]OHB00907.1 MAG: hypothetical protein A3E94_01495 [Candidatus Zambryskibacteria bacterium RIFCSPHIGHO2_12_FULL_44_12b]OHB04371.1 MAG: hypothetical protein A3B14_01825 [Candidatus Zambryskibacteria bacterium RIFCSPLOWO2_01_FULL_45_21]